MKAKLFATGLETLEKTFSETPPEPSRVKLSLRELEMEEYLKVATSIGLDSDLGYLLEPRLKKVLLDENIRVYDYEQVCRFLDIKLGKEWKWLSLRQIDADEFPGDNWGHTMAGHRRTFSVKRYNRPIPLPVLLTVKKIVNAIPEARFYVSGIDKDADPFLCVTTKLLHVHVIERWDEPDYRER